MTRLGEALVLRGDARTLPLPDDSVDLIVTSPPYFALRSYQDGGEHYAGQIGSEESPTAFLDALLEVTRECVRVLKPSGSLWVNLGDKYSTGASGMSAIAELGQQGYRGGGHTDAKAKRKSAPVAGMRPKSLVGIPWRYAIRCIDELDLILRAEVIWSKPNPLPESVTDRVRRSHEQWFHFTREPQYFAGIDEVREPHSSGTHPGRTRTVESESGNGVTHRTFAGNTDLSNPRGRVPGSVWSIATEPLSVPAELEVEHFAAFPTEWPRRLIQGWCPAGICTACGEGRRPETVTEQELYRQAGATGRPKRQSLDSRAGNGVNAAGYPQTISSTRITGYVCGCNDVIATPQGSTAGPDPTRETGRGRLNRPRSEAGVRLITRWEQRHEAAQLKASSHRAAMREEAGPSAFAHYLRTDRSGARPIPEGLREVWQERGWLLPVPEYSPAPTRPAVVLDPFGGTGTTALVAKALGRVGVSVDMSADYSRLARWRTTDRDQLAKVLGMGKVEQQPAEQLDLLEGLMG